MRRLWLLCIVALEDVGYLKTRSGVMKHPKNAQEDFKRCVLELKPVPKCRKYAEIIEMRKRGEAELSTLGV